jgi:hypothetical protein
MSGCTVFVFMSLMEYALVNILMGDIVDGEESALKKGMKSMFMTTAGGGHNNRSGGSTRMPTTTSQQVRERNILQKIPLFLFLFYFCALRIHNVLYRLHLSTGMYGYVSRLQG